MSGKTHINGNNIVSTALPEMVRGINSLRNAYDKAVLIKSSSIPKTFRHKEYVISLLESEIKEILTETKNLESKIEVKLKEVADLNQKDIRALNDNLSEINAQFGFGSSHHGGKNYGEGAHAESLGNRGGLSREQLSEETHKRFSWKAYLTTAGFIASFAVDPIALAVGGIVKGVVAVGKGFKVAQGILKAGSKTIGNAAKGASWYSKVAPAVSVASNIGEKIGVGLSKAGTVISKPAISAAGKIQGAAVKISTKYQAITDKLVDVGDDLIAFQGKLENIGGRKIAESFSSTIKDFTGYSKKQLNSPAGVLDFGDWLSTKMFNHSPKTKPIIKSNGEGLGIKYGSGNEGAFNTLINDTPGDVIKSFKESLTPKQIESITKNDSSGKYFDIEKLSENEKYDILSKLDDQMIMHTSGKFTNPSEYLEIINFSVDNIERLKALEKLDKVNDIITKRIDVNNYLTKILDKGETNIEIDLGKLFFGNGSNSTFKDPTSMKQFFADHFKEFYSDQFGTKRLNSPEEQQLIIDFFNGAIEKAFKTNNTNAIGAFNKLSQYIGGARGKFGVVLDDITDAGYFTRNSNATYIAFNSIFTKNKDISNMYHELGHALHYYISGNNVPAKFFEYNGFAKVALKSMDNNNPLIKYLKKHSDIIMKEGNSYYSGLLKNKTEIYKENKDIFDLIMNSGSLEETKKILENYGISKKSIPSDLYKEEAVEMILKSEVGKKTTMYLDNYISNDKSLRKYMRISDIIDSLSHGENIKGDILFGKHGTEYYKKNPEAIFREQIANFTSLKMDGAEKELKLLKESLPKEWYDTLEKQFSKFTD